MTKFFTRERFGTPQFAALALLCCFLAQCLWLIHRLIRATPEETISNLLIVDEGLRQWHGRGIAGTPSGRDDAGAQLWQHSQLGFHSDYDRNHSPLFYLIAATPVLVAGASAFPLQPGAGISPALRWLMRAPFLVFGALLGASVWYVARRLYGNPGGYIALALYCFSPLIVSASAMTLVQPEIGAAWGAFGAIFTAIAVAHTLYAPREVVLWNWRRILLLGVSLVLAVGSQFSTVIILPFALIFMLYLAPTRRLAALVILLSSCAIAFLVLWGCYRFSFAALVDGFRHAQFFSVSTAAIRMKITYQLLGTTLVRTGPAIMLLLLISVVTYFSWPRTRYFGATAPLLVWIIFLLIAILSPHSPGLGFSLLAVPFMFVFIAGIFADLLETPHRSLVAACLLGVIAAHALWSLLGLARL